MPLLPTAASQVKTPIMKQPMDRKTLRGIAHRLKPIVTVADKGLSENVIKEVERALRDHELIKVRLVVGDRVLRTTLINTLCEQLQAELVQRIGNIAVLYRAAEKPDPRLSNLQRPQ